MFTDAENPNFKSDPKNGGRKGEFLALRPVICVSFITVAVLSVPLAFSKGL